MRNRMTAAVVLVSAALGGVAGPRACSSCGIEGTPLVEQRMESDYGAADCDSDAAILAVPEPAEDRKGVVPPTEAAVFAARELAVVLPGSKVYFSQTSGRPMWVHADGAALHPGAFPEGDQGLEALATVQAFLAAYPQLFGVVEPRAEIVVRRTLEGQAPAFRRDPDTGRHALNFARVHNGMVMDGNGGVALFDADGDLLTLVARLDPTEAVRSEFAELDRKTATVRSTWPDRGEPRWGRVRGEPALLRVSTTEVFALDPETGQASPLHPLPSVRSAVPLGDVTGTLPKPIEWTLEGEVVEVPAPDSLGTPIDVLSTWDGRVLSLGWHSTGYLAEGAAVSVADAEHKLIAFAGLIFYPGPPIATVHPTWAQDPDYAGRYGAATDLAANVRHVVEWFHRELELDSWDDRGASLRTAINANPWLIPNGFFNAYAGSGYLMIGDAPGPNGRTMAAASDVVGHEYAHLFQQGNGNLRYHGEAGAVAESVADILGNSVGGIDASYEIAEATGEAVRDMGSPERFGLPGTYDGFLLTDEDNGGTHTNSGILDRAAVSVWEDYERDPLPLAELIVDGFRDVPFDEQSRIEEFGSALLAYCYVRKVTESTYGYHADLCESVKRGLCTTRVLRDVDY